MHLRELDANLIVILDALLMEASVTKAAERLGRSPSAVSHALARLREIFDDPLFVRAGQRLVPTSHATQIAPTVHIIVSGLEGLLHRQHLFDPSAQQRGFSIACGDVLELTLLARLRAELAEVAPRVTITRHAMHGAGIVEAMRAGQVDLAITESAIDGQASDISRETLGDDPFVALAPPAHSLTGQNVRASEILASDTTIIADEMQAQTAFCDTGQARPSGLVTVSSVLVALHTALERGALAVVTQSLAAVATRHMGFHQLPCALALPALSLQLMWHVSQERDESHAWLRERVRYSAAASRKSQPERNVPAITA